MFMTLSCGTTITIYSYPRSFYYTTFADLLDKHRFSLSNDLWNVMRAFYSLWIGRQRIPRKPFQNNTNSAAVAGNGADAKWLLAGVQGMLGLARKDTSSELRHLGFESGC
ncbi:hypothetical protein C8R48DRAFT_680103 [Suillus tomentosus]|nr:hypothetical protein C8R48DRAFT_680103 [Suillus tomentosus]